MASLKDQIAAELSELRTMVLGAQIFLGFQYQALFAPRFHAALALSAPFYLIGFAALAAAIIILIAPVSHHRLAEAGEATPAQSAFAGFALCAGALVFALSLGADVAFATGVAIGQAAPWIGGAAVLAALALWFAMELMMRRPQSAPPTPHEAVSLKDRISELLSEGRIVLPGVQALLGFQMAAYLSDGFARLPNDAQMAHHLGLGLLLASMILLMAPAPFHRIAERGVASSRMEKIGVALTMSGLSLLALALSADLYVAVTASLHDEHRALASALVAAIAAFAVWFAYPLSRKARHGARSHETAAQS